MNRMFTVDIHSLTSCTMSGLRAILLTLLCISFFTNTHAQTKITGFGDTIKGNVKKMIEFREETDVYIVAVYTWDTIAHTSTIKYFKEDRTYKGKSISSFDSNSRLTSQNLYCHNNKLCTKLNLQYDMQGREVEYHYVHYGHRDYSTYPGDCNSLYDWLNGQITYWIIGFDSSIEIHRRVFDNDGRLANKMDVSILDNDSTVKLTENKHDVSGNKIESITLTISSRTSDTTVEIVRYRYYDSGDKYVEQTKVSYPLGYAWPDTTIDVTRNIHYTEEELYNSDRLGKYVNKEYDKQGNIIRIPSLFRREIEYY